MPLTHFTCPDGQQIDIGSCLQSCRMGRRCLTLPTLLSIVTAERPPQDRPSITTLLNGTMLTFLKATMPYSVEPRSRAFILIGNDHHRKLAALAEGNSTMAETQQGSEITGTHDVLEPDEQDPSKYVLTDYKTYGSYRVAKMLGLRNREVQHPTEVYKTSGKWGKAGTPRKIKEWYHDETFVDMFDEEMQLNGYRMLLEEQGYPISRMQIQVTVRDGGVQIARERGIDQPMYMVDVKKLPDDVVWGFFQQQKQQLEQAFQQGHWDVPCNDRESWNGRRCIGYCEVAQYCPRGKQEKEKASRGRG